MIPFDWEYHRPDDAGEAASAFRDLREQGKHPVYYGGGTEILTLARLGRLRPGAVVDLKGVPDCSAVAEQGGVVQLGAACNLGALGDANPWPLLTAAAGRVADHTSRRKITLGGNLAGRIRYREAVLPLLASDARAALVGPGGRREVPFADAWDGSLRLGPDEFLAQVLVPSADVGRPYFCVKKTRLDWIDYPLVTAVAVRAEGRLRLALSGLCAEPFRCRAMEEPLGEKGVPESERVDEAIRRIPHDVVDDMHGSADYRRHILRNVLLDALQALG